MQRARLETEIQQHMTKRLVELGFPPTLSQVKQEQEAQVADGMQEDLPLMPPTEPPTSPQIGAEDDALPPPSPPAEKDDYAKEHDNITAFVENILRFDIKEANDHANQLLPHFHSRKSDDDQETTDAITAQMM